MIYVVTHADLIEDIKLPQGYQLARVHVTDHANPEKYLYTDTLDNIDNKNANYCELTALYWIWKNSKESYVGLNHYRRRFVDDQENGIPENKLKKILEDSKSDLIVKGFWKVPAYQTYLKKWVYESDIELVFNITKKLYPAYSATIENLKKENKIDYNCNIIYCKKELFDEYCTWLFSILFKAEKQLATKVKNYALPYSRIYGYMAEILFNVYVRYNKLIAYPQRITDKAKTAQLPSIGKTKQNTEHKQPKDKPKKEIKADGRAGAYLYF